MAEYRKCKVVWITPELIQQMLTVGNQIKVEIQEGLPEGAVYTRAYFDRCRGYVGLIFYHPDFEPWQEGMTPEQIQVVLRRLDNGH